MPITPLNPLPSPNDPGFEDAIEARLNAEVVFSQELNALEANVNQKEALATAAGAIAQAALNAGLANAPAYAAAAAASAAAAAAYAAVLNLTAPGPIGGATPAAGAFTTLNVSDVITLLMGGSVRAGHKLYFLNLAESHALAISSPDGDVLRVSSNAGAAIADFSPAGLAVTGALSATGQWNVNASRLHFDKSGTRSWDMYTNQTSGDLVVQSGDSLGNINLNSKVIVTQNGGLVVGVDGALPANGYNLSGPAFGGAIELRSNSATVDRGWRLGMRSSGAEFYPKMSYLDTAPDFVDFTVGIRSYSNTLNPVAALINTNTSFASNVADIECARNTSDGTYNFIACAVQGVEYRFYVRDSGNVVNTNNSYGAISDLKLKENITDATPKLAKLMRVRIVNYNLITDPTHKQIGVIAQELEEISPGLIEETPDCIDVEVEPARTEVRVTQRQKTELRESVRYETTLVDGQWRKLPIATMEAVPLFEDHPLFDETGAEIMEVVESEQPEVLDKDGEVITPFKAAEYRQATHRVPVMEAVEEVVEVPAKFERKATGETTKSVKYSIFVPMLIKALQEQQGIIEALAARITALEAA